MAKSTKVGLLVVAALVIVMVTIMLLGQGRFWERKIPYELHFARTNGLQPGAQVSLSGVPMGSVEGLSFPSDPAARYIVVTIRVEGDVASRVRQDTLASIRTFGLLGDRYIELTPGSPEADPVPPGGLVPSVDPTDVEALLGQSGDIVTNIVEVTTSLRDVLQTIQRGEGLLGAMVRNREFGDQTLRDLQRTLANAEATSKSLASILDGVERGEGILGHLVRDSKEGRELIVNLDTSARSLARVVVRLERGGGVVGRLIDDDAYAKRVLVNLDQSLQNLNELTTKLNQGQGTLGRLVNDPTLYEQVKGLLGGTSGSFLFRLYRAFSGGRGDAGPPPPAGGAAAP